MNCRTRTTRRADGAEQRVSDVTATLKGAARKHKTKAKNRGEVLGGAAWLPRTDSTTPRTPGLGGVGGVEGEGAASGRVILPRHVSRNSPYEMTLTTKMYAEASMMCSISAAVIHFAPGHFLLRSNVRGNPVYGGLHVHVCECPKVAESGCRAGVSARVTRPQRNRYMHLFFFSDAMTCFSQ